MLFVLSVTTNILMFSVFFKKNCSRKPPRNSLLSLFSLGLEKYINTRGWFIDSNLNNTILQHNSFISLSQYTIKMWFIGTIDILNQYLKSQTHYSSFPYTFISSTVCTFIQQNNFMISLLSIRVYSHLLYLSSYHIHCVCMYRY